MAIGERIRFFRNLRGMTQKYLGLKAGLGEKTADIRMAQYEAGTRTPKDDLTKSVAGILEVSPSALTVPDFDSDIGLMHSLFYLEDEYGFTIEKEGDAVSFHIDPKKSDRAAELLKALEQWADMAAQYKNGDIDRDAYNDWRYLYPKYAKGYKKIKSL